MDFESIFERMSRARNGAISSVVVDHGNPASWHGSKATTTVACQSDDEVLDGLLNAMPSHSFSFGRFTALADALGCKYSVMYPPKRDVEALLGITNKTNGEVVADGAPATALEELPDLSKVLSGLDARLKQLYDALPSRTAIIIFTGHSDPRRMAALNMRKSSFETAIRSGKSPEDLNSSDTRWTSADGRALEEEVEKAKRGLVFLGIKDTK